MNQSDSDCYCSDTEKCRIQVLNRSVQYADEEEQFYAKERIRRILWDVFSGRIREDDTGLL